ncbi:hypothetical protein I2F27_12425 [Acinetobacter sp. B5B]|uniref:hypothetical protein n=1 Tax=Acinetobacter baretiae TaxID=2605383 RepID=UPI0018C26A4F|nr:hypothetical protein [Acinetobacter baretiae]MBF7684094.1 hypothetical protein [Acinetobacter baretiae]
MFEFIGLVVLLVVGWVILKMILIRVFPEYGLRDAEARYKRDPDHVNERMLWDAKRRVNKSRE